MVPISRDTESERVCRQCGKKNVPHRFGPAVCSDCTRANYLIVKQRYRRSLKGRTTTRAYEELDYVRERRRIFSRSTMGRRNKAKYEATEKGKATRREASQRYRQSEKGQTTASYRHQRTKNDPKRIRQRRVADRKYKQSEKGKALKMREYARRRHAILASVNTLTATEWGAILQLGGGKCHYCGTEARLTVDHIIPLSRGGTHTKENVVPACLSCNVRKGNRILGGLIARAATNAPMPTA